MRFGIIGAGAIGAFHAKSIKAMDGEILSHVTENK